MKVEGPKGPQALQRTGAARKSGEAGAFSKLLGSGEASESAAASPTMGVGGVEGLFMLQAGSEDERKRTAKARARAEAGLTLLDQITYALLNNNVSTAHLARLKAIASAETESVSDPRLAAVLDEIDLRLAVEVAKLERASESAISRG